MDPKYCQVWSDWRHTNKDSPHGHFSFSEQCGYPAVTKLDDGTPACKKCFGRLGGKAPENKGD